MLVLSVQAQPLAMHCQCSVHSSTGLWPALTVPVRASGRYLNVQCGPVRCAERARKPYRVQYVSTILLNMYKQLYRQSYKQSDRPTLSISIYLSADPDPCTGLRDVARRFPTRIYLMLVSDSESDAPTTSGAMTSGSPSCHFWLYRVTTQPRR